MEDLLYVDADVQVLLLASADWLSPVSLVGYRKERDRKMIRTFCQPVNIFSNPGGAKSRAQ